MLSASAIEGTDVVEAVVDGPVDEAAVTALRDLLQRTGDGSARLLVVVREDAGVTTAAVQEALRRLDLPRTISRCAAVSSRPGPRAGVQAAAALVPVRGRAFADRAEALARRQA